MDVIELEGHVNQDGELEIALPRSFPSGKVRVRIEPIYEPLSEAEAEQLMRTQPISGAEIVAAGLTGAWADADIR